MILRAFLHIGVSALFLSHCYCEPASSCDSKAGHGISSVFSALDQLSSAGFECQDEDERPLGAEDSVLAIVGCDEEGARLGFTIRVS